MTQKPPLQANDLYRLRIITDAEISPDGSRVAFVLRRLDEEKNDYVTNIYVVDRGGAVSQYTSGDKDSTPRWSPDGKYLAFLSGRKEKAQLHLLPTAGGESVAVTDRKLGAGVPVWSPDGKTIVFTGMVSTDPEEEQEKESADKNGDKTAKTKVVDRASYKLDGAGYLGNRRSHIFLLDVADRKLEQLTDGDYFDDNPTWSPDGQHLAFSSGRGVRWDVSTESSIYVVPASGGNARALTSGGSYVHPVFSPDGSRIAFIGHRDAEEGIFAPPRIYSVNRSGSDFREELGAWDGNLGNEILSDVVQSAIPHSTTMIWRSNGLYFNGTERGEVNIYCTDGAVHPVTQGRHTITDFSIADDGTIAYACGDATHPVEICLQHNGESKQLTHENEAFLNEVRIAQPERISFVGANGEESEGWLIPPQGYESGKHPLIVYIHGGPMMAYGEAFHFEYQFLAGQGFGVFYPNIHGSASYGRAYQTSINGDWGNLDYQDVLAGAEAAKSREWVDRQRVGIAGGSYGGYMTNWVMTHGDQFQAAVTERCVCNILSFMGTSDSGWIWNRSFGVYPEEDVQKLWDMSPIKYVANVKAPMLVIHSEQDDRTPIEQGEQMFSALRRLGKETRFIVFPEESHGLSRGGKPSRRVERMGYILDWFREHL